VHSAEMRAAESHLLNVRSLSERRNRTYAPAAKFFQLSELRRLRRSEQVAAVCYRIRGKAIEFLLVQTRGGRWIFPKGSAEPGLTHAQAAALEAFEEAGVHGRIEEASFARYVRRRHADPVEKGEVQFTVKAYLCEVLWLDPPQELDRRPTWFSAEKAMRRLRDERAAHYGAELVRIVESAVRRIQRVYPGTNTFVDSAEVGSSQKVQFINSGARDNTRRKRNPA
jgi:8-oxo-dGTP pyrophosphatase MutT (NUDIX family)